jgi:hypothetical protein
LFEKNFCRKENEGSKRCPFTLFPHLHPLLGKVN